MDELVSGPVAANYPNGELLPVEQLDPPPVGHATWSAELRLTPELLPILRHGQFEDLLNGNFADPITSILRAVAPKDGVQASVAISIVPASERRRRVALRALRLLDRTFFRHHPRLAEYYAEHITRSRRRFLSLALGFFARKSALPHHTVMANSMT